MLFVAVLAAGITMYIYGRSIWVPVVQQMVGKRSVAEVIGQYGDVARARMAPYFDAAGLAYPPEQVVLLALKDSATLELWAVAGATPVFIRRYPIQALSGIAGPKLREGDKQVPEGIYRIIGLNPNSAYHLSMKLDYPNRFDLRHAAAEGRDQPGSDIFIHGKAVSVGCLAMGDETIEELFVLAADVGIEHFSVAIAPTDPRLKQLSTTDGPPWLLDLYTRLKAFFSDFRNAGL